METKNGEKNGLILRLKGDFGPMIISVKEVVLVETTSTGQSKIHFSNNTFVLSETSVDDILEIIAEGYRSYNREET